jgi:hypothetical protein
VGGDSCNGKKMLDIVAMPLSSGNSSGAASMLKPETTAVCIQSALVLSYLVKPESSAIPSAVQSLSQHIIPSAPAKSPGAPSQSIAYRLVLSQRIMTMLPILNGTSQSSLTSHTY